MKKLIALILLTSTLFTASVQANDHVTIAIRTNQFTTPAMAVKFAFLAEHVAPKHLSDSFHGIKVSCRGGQWSQYTNTLGHVWMVNNFRKSELEKKTYTHTYDENGDVTNTVTHGKTVDNARIETVRGGSPQGAFKIELNADPKAKLIEWGLFAVLNEEDEE